MIKEMLESYVTNKQLQKKISKKARDEIFEILTNAVSVGNDEWASITENLLNLPPEVMYDFICGLYGDLKAEQKSILYSKILDKCKQDSARMVLYSCVSLNNASDTEKAGKLLYNLITAHWKNGKFDVNIVSAFCSAVELEGGKFLYQKFENWDKRTLGIYAELLLLSAERDKSTVQAESIMTWFKENDLEINASQNARLASLSIAMSECAGVKKDVDEKPTSSNIENRTDESKPKTLNDYASVDLLAELTERVCMYEKHTMELEDRNINLLKENSNLEDQIGWFSSAKSVADSELDRAKRQLHDVQEMCAEKEHELKRLSLELGDTRTRYADLQDSYRELSNSFDQKVKAETDSFFVEIEKRLTNDYKVFNEMKSLTPDAECYEALVATLEKVFNTLINNGVKL